MFFYGLFSEIKINNVNLIFIWHGFTAGKISEMVCWTCGVVKTEWSEPGVSRLNIEFREKLI